MAQTKKLLVAFDPSRPRQSSSDFLVPTSVRGKRVLFSLKTGTPHDLGLMVFVGRPVSEDDLLEKRARHNLKLELDSCGIDDLREFIERLQSFRIGNIIRLQTSSSGDSELELVANSPSGFQKRERENLGGG